MKPILSPTEQSFVVEAELWKLIHFSENSLVKFDLCARNTTRITWIL